MSSLFVLIKKFVKSINEGLEFVKKAYEWFVNFMNETFK